MSLPAALTRWFRRVFPQKPLGRRGEEAAAAYLKRRGYKVLARGSRLRPGELDLVMLDGRTIVFVEVKTRQTQEAGHPSEFVDEAKQRRLSRLAVTFSEASLAHGAAGAVRRRGGHLARRPPQAGNRTFSQRVRRRGEMGVLLLKQGRSRETASRARAATWCRPFSSRLEPARQAVSRLRFRAALREAPSLPLVPAVTTVLKSGDFRDASEPPREEIPCHGATTSTKSS